MAYGDKWDSRSFPDGCRGCGQTAYKHVGQGLCNRCYRRWAKSGKDVEEWLVDPEREVSPPVADVIERGSDDEPSPAIRSEEVRPGSAGSPLATDDAPPPGVTEKKRSFFGKKKPDVPRVEPVRKTTERRPSSGRRTTAADSLGDLYAAVGGFLARSPQNAPLGRYLQWQAPAAGELLDSVVANTFVDRKLLQPAVKMRGSVDVLAALFGPPALIIAIERNPSRAEVLLPMLESSIRSSLPTLLPAMKKSQEREEKVAKAVKEMFPDMPDGVDPVRLVIEQMFAGWIRPAEPEPETTEPESAPSF